MDLYSLVWDAISPYLYGIVKLAFAFAMFSMSIKYMRQKQGSYSGDLYAGFTNAFIAYFLCRSISIIISLTDVVCNKILANINI